MEIFRDSGLPIALVPCFHQSNVCIKRMLQVWRVHKCNLLVGEKIVQTGAGLQTTTCHAAPYRAGKINFRKFWSTYCLGTVFAPKRCLYQKEGAGVEIPKV